MANVTIPEMGGRFLIGSIPEEEASQFAQLGMTWLSVLLFEFYVPLTAVYTFHGDYRIAPSVGGNGKQARARLNINSGTYILAQASRKPAGFAYVNASEQAGGSLAQGWHTCEVEISNEDFINTTFIKGVAITFGLS